ncbi:MAG: hypothetical protein ACLP51_12420 [Syntrophobacteraceae bacterium]
MSDLKIVWFLRLQECSGGFFGQRPENAVGMLGTEVGALFWLIAVFTV